MDRFGKQRRRILRRVLTSGCVLAVPSLLAGCGRDQESPPDPETAGGESPASAETTAAEAGSSDVRGGGKMSQEKAQYQGQPKGDQQCSNCLHFVAENNTCKLVKGQISPQGWCVLWTEQA